MARIVWLCEVLSENMTMKISTMSKWRGRRAAAVKEDIKQIVKAVVSLRMYK